MTSQLRRKRQITQPITLEVKGRNAATPPQAACCAPAGIRRRWLPTTAMALAAVLFSQSALLASDGPPPGRSKESDRSKETSRREAPRFFIGRNSQQANQSHRADRGVAHADAKEAIADRVVTTRGTKRNTKLKWRSVRAKSTPVIQQTAHGEEVKSNSRGNSVLKNASAAPLPALDPLHDPFGDRLAAQPDFDEDDSETPATPPVTSSDDGDFGPPNLDGETPPTTRAPATDRIDPFGDEPQTAAPAEPAQPGIDRPSEPAETFVAPREDSTSDNELSPQEQNDKKYRKELAEECEEGLQELRIKTLAATSLHHRLDISEKGTALKDFPISCPVDNSEFSPRSWDEMYIAWTASGLCHKPLYSEEVQLERYGHSAGPYTQPLISMAHFFGSVAVMPYSMGLKTPNECVYPLGYYRPGNCAPYMVPAVPFTARAALFQAGAIVGVGAILP